MLCLFPVLLLLVTASENPLLRKIDAQSSKAPLIVGHRGDSAHFPENTLAAFASAIDQGAGVVELDFHESADGVLYCLHDSTLDRTTDADEKRGQKEIPSDALPWAELKALDAGSWKGPQFAGTRLPSLEEAMHTILPRAIPMIEHKKGKAETLVRLLRKNKLVRKVLVQSFDWEWLEEVHALEPDVVIAALGPTRGKPEPDAADFRAQLRPTGASIVHWSARELTVEKCAALRKAGLRICAYTINDDLTMAGAARFGLQLITTDRPARLRRLIEQGYATHP